MARRPHALVLSAALALGLAGCADGDVDEAATPASSSSPAVSEPGTEETTAQRADMDEEASATPADFEVCLVGVWLADNEYFLASMQEVGDAVDSVGGHVNLSFFADGTFTTEYNDWEINSSDEGDAVVIHRSGVDSGVYSVADGRLALEETEVGSSMTVSMGDMEMAVAPVPASFASAAFTCAATSASIEAPEGTLKLTRN